MTSLERAVTKDRVIVITSLVVLAAAAWAYTGYLAWEMEGMDMGPEMVMPQMQTWTLIDLLLLFVMWTVMMVAMMVPSAAPMVLMFANVQRQRQKQQRPFVSTGVFLLGYLIIWTAFSLITTLAQWGLHSTALLSPMMISTSSLFGGVLLMAAGIFQWTPLKHTCLKHCRSPLGFITTDWRDGTWGALIMGLRHGSYCTGCCWALMALLFVVGVMNLFWVAMIAVFVLIEKIVPNGHWVSKASGLMLIGWGIWMIQTGW